MSNQKGQKGQKGLAQRIERMLEDGLSDAFALVFGGSIVPAEIEALLRREASDGVETLAGERLLAPNEYVITLAEADFGRLPADDELAARAFEQRLSGYIHDQGWQTYGQVVVRIEQSAGLHTGQYRARAVVNPDAEADPRRSASTAAPAESTHAPTAESGVPAMTDNPGYPSGPGQDRPGDEYYEEPYGRPEDARAPEQQPGQYPPPPHYQQGYPPRPVYPEQGGYPEQGYGQSYGGQPYGGQSYGGQPYGGQNYGGPNYGGQHYPAPGYEQRPPAPGYGPPDQGYRPPPPQPGYGGQPYGPPPGSGYPPPQSEYDYARPRYDDPGYGRPEPRPAYPQQPGYQPDYGQQPQYGGYEQGYDQGYEQGYPPPAAPTGYEYGQSEYAAAAHAVTLQLDDGSGRTYELREGANVVGRGQDAQFRLPDTGVSRRHLEIRWDGQVALLSDLNSTNGTTVNNAPVQEWQLADGDVIRVGHSEIIVHVR